jgi:hypothetical protein
VEYTPELFITTSVAASNPTSFIKQFISLNEGYCNITNEVMGTANLLGP